MKTARRKVGSTLFKGMMAVGAIYDLSRLASAVDRALNESRSMSSSELLPRGDTGCTEPAFTGGAGASNVMHNRGHWMISDGKRMVQEGEKLKRIGSGTPYDPELIRRGQSMITEGKGLIRKGKDLIEKAKSMRSGT